MHTTLKGTKCLLISDVLLLCSASGKERWNRGIIISSHPTSSINHLHLTCIIHLYMKKVTLSLP